MQELLTTLIKILESCRAINHFFYDSFAIEYNLDNKWTELEPGTSFSIFENSVPIRVLEVKRDTKLADLTSPRDGKGKEKSKGKGKSKKGKGDKKGGNEVEDSGKGKEKEEEGEKHIVPITVQRRYTLFYLFLNLSRNFSDKPKV
jgi:hypothetical protein